MPHSPIQTRYANSDGVHIAHQVVGEGPLDLIFVPGWVSHVEHHWEEPRLAYFLHRVGLCLGAQAGESRLRKVLASGGFSRFRRASETPFNLVFEARP
jgi:hypothetical protein